MPSSSQVPSTDSTDLMVAARIIGSECYESNKRFLECKSEDKNPQTCLASGEKVAGCVFKVLRTLENQCTDSFHAYKKAMDDRWHEITECRKEQYAMEDCYRKFKNDKATVATTTANEESN